MFQGTAKPIRCTVIWDSVPDRMSLDELENITNMLCYAHGIVMSPVSVPAPLYSAGDLAKRGRNTLKEYNGADNSSCSGGNESADVANLSRKLKTALRTKYWA
ncbi:piwi domain-containing protein [Ditylenchus destructor]|nr:piwi domain-containing protein [Ditylenchus destructor]